MDAVNRHTTSNRQPPPQRPSLRPAPRLDYLPRLLRLGFRHIGPHARGLAGYLAYRLWFSTRRYPEPAREARWIASACIDRVGWRERKLTRYQWGDPAAPAVLLIHGWNGRGPQLGAFARALVQAGYRAVAFDAPGHGRSPGTSTNIFEYAEAIQIVTHASGPVVAAIAHSFGVPASAQALNQGLQLQRLVAIAAPANAEFLLDRFKTMFDIPSVVMMEMRKRVERHFGMDIFARLATDAMLAERTLPGLIIHDRSDQEVPSDHAERLHRAWPCSEIRLVNGLGHRRLLRDPDVVAAAVAFIAQTAASIRAGGDIRQTAGAAAMMQRDDQPQS